LEKKEKAQLEKKEIKILEETEGQEQSNFCKQSPDVGQAAAEHFIPRQRDQMIQRIKLGFIFALLALGAAANVIWIVTLFAVIFHG
jgi:hypothetical protein